MRNILKTAVISIGAIFIISNVYAKDVKVNVELTTNELAFSLNILNTIELAGEEVGPFLDVKNLLTDSYKEASSSKKTSVTVDFSEPVAKNFLFFMQRAKLKGSDATIFYDLSKKMVDSIKKAAGK